MKMAQDVWAEMVHETGVWLSPFAEQIAEIGCIIIPKMQALIEAAVAEERAECAAIARSNSHWEAWRVADAIERK